MRVACARRRRTCQARSRKRDSLQRRAAGQRSGVGRRTTTSCRRRDKRAPHRSCRGTAFPLISACGNHRRLRPSHAGRGSWCSSWSARRRKPCVERVTAGQREGPSLRVAMLPAERSCHRGRSDRWPPGRVCRWRSRSHERAGLRLMGHVAAGALVRGSRRPGRADRSPKPAVDRACGWATTLLARRR